MRNTTSALLMLLVLAACGDTATTEAPASEAPTTVASTSVAPATDAPSTTMAAATTTTTTTVPPTVVPEPQTFEAKVSWDGTTCTYEGPSRVYAEDTVNITYRNDSAEVADFEIDYLIAGSTLEELDEVTGDFLDRATAVFPDFIVEVAFYPGGRGSLGAGESGTDSLVLDTPRVHAFTCFGGQASGDQVVDVASEALAVDEYSPDDY